MSEAKLKRLAKAYFQAPTKATREDAKRDFHDACPHAMEGDQMLYRTPRGNFVYLSLALAKWCHA